MPSHLAKAGEMAKPCAVLKTNSQKAVTLKDGRIAIVASRYNQRYVDGMLRAAQAVLKASGIGKVEVVRVPGAFEIPVAVAALLRRAEDAPEAVICLGVIWQGATLHAQHIGEAITDALMRLAVDSGVPVIHEVLTIATREQAEARCLSPDMNRGTEAAQTAVAMAGLMRRLKGQGREGTHHEPRRKNMEHRTSNAEHRTRNTPAARRK